MQNLKTKLLTISVIIPVRQDSDFKPALKALSKIDYPSKLFEIIVVYGSLPSKQRNKAVLKAKGEILYFLDNDSEIEKRAFKRVVDIFLGKIKQVKISQTRGFSVFPDWLSKLIIKHFFSGKIYKGEIAVVGGPNVWWGKETFWVSIAGAVMESFFIHTLMAARYRPIGDIHRVTEKELILCNLAIRKDVFNKVGAFNENLYPNEENELLNRIHKAGYQLIYHPGVLVFRPHRASLKSLLGAFLHYGQGRMEQVRVEGLWQSLPILVPLVFFLYLLVLPFYYQWWLLFPLLLYLIMAFGSALGYFQRRGKFYLIFFLPMVFLINHLAYAVGCIYGLTTSLKQRRKRGNKIKIKVVKIKSFREDWRSSDFKLY
ncbi:hypothetical protein ACFLZ1_02350 [Patescibacteria group bacterium]